MRLALALACVLAACTGDDEVIPGTPDAAPPPPDAAPACVGDVADCLRALPGVASVDEMPPQLDPTVRWLRVGFTQPRDHQAPEAGTYVQYASIVLRDARTRPTVLLTSGYEEFYGEYQEELTQALAANQISLEHRYFGDSLPADADWNQLTIQQMADDEHAIVEMLRPIFSGRWVSTGASKGGMTASYHRRFYPDDVDGTLAMVAPMSFSPADTRYDAYFELLGSPACKSQLEGVLGEILGPRRANFLAFTQHEADQLGYHFATFSIDASLDAAAAEGAWGFWQYDGDCGGVPDPAADDTTLWSWFTRVSWPVMLAEEVETTAEPYGYSWQAATQLGYQDWTENALEPLFVDRPDPQALFMWGVAFPQPVPPHDPQAMLDVQDWVQHEARDLALVYGQWDPWTGGRYDIGDNPDVLELVVPGANHGASIFDLEPADREALFDAIEAWSGVRPLAARITQKGYLEVRQRARLAEKTQRARQRAAGHVADAVVETAP